jgi:regulatory protein
MRRKDSGADPPGARDTALGMLSRREHSRRDLKRKLTSRGIDADAADDAIEQLQRDSYQSDERFAEALVRHRAGSGHGPRYILSELGSHGIAAALVRPLLEEHDWDAIATALVLRKKASGVDPETLRRRLLGMLQRRGFEGDSVRCAMAALKLRQAADDE